MAGQKQETKPVFPGFAKNKMQQVAKEAKQWLESEETQRGLKRLKRTFLHHWKNFTKEAKHVAEDAAGEAKHRAAHAYEHAREAVERKMH